jgi:hypothetical protein
MSSTHDNNQSVLAQAESKKIETTTKTPLSLLEIEKCEPCTTKHGHAGQKVFFLYRTHSSSETTFERHYLIAGKNINDTVHVQPKDFPRSSEDDSFLMPLHFVLDQPGQKITVIAIQDKHAQQKEFEYDDKNLK